jgi:uncharacterized protein
MPRFFFRKITPRRETVRNHWALKPFSRFFGDPRLWSLQRRTVTPAFGAGLAICFIPLPIHIPVAALVAIFCRIHIPTIMVTLIAVNPLTVVPAYLLAYKVGVIVTEAPPLHFQFELSWDWLQQGLGPIWKPFLVIPRGLRGHGRVVRAGGIPAARRAVALQRAQEISRARRRRQQVIRSFRPDFRVPAPARDPCARPACGHASPR